MEKLETIVSEALKLFSSVDDAAQLEQAKARYLGKAGALTGLLKALGYIPHGLPEVMAYFIGSIAGGIISVAITKKKYKTHEFEQIAKDVLYLLVLSYVVLFVGALVEAYFIVGG